MTVAAGVTSMGRLHAETLMTSVGTIKRQTGTTTDPVTLVEVPVYGTTVYSGKCRIKFPKGDPSTVAIPGTVATVQTPEVHIPVEAAGSGDVKVNDVFECTVNPLDTSLVGVRFRIAGLHMGTYMTARRFPVEQVN